MLSESEIILFSKTYNHSIWNCLPIGSIWNSPEHTPREEGALQLWHTHCVIKHVCLQHGVPPRYFYPLCVWGQDCVGDKCFFVLLWVSHALNSGCQAWGQYLLSQVSSPHVPFSPWALRHSLDVCLLPSLPVFFPYSRSSWMITLDCSQPCRISPSGKSSDWEDGEERADSCSTGHILTMEWLS